MRCLRFCSTAWRVYFSQSFICHNPKYAIGAKDEKVTPHFPDAKAWEWIHLPKQLLGVLRSHKRKVGLREDFNPGSQRFKGPPRQFSELLEHQSLLLRDLGFHIVQHLPFLEGSTWVPKIKCLFPIKTSYVMAEPVSLLKHLLFPPCSATCLLFFLLLLC